MDIELQQQVGKWGTNEHKRTCNNLDIFCSVHDIDDNRGFGMSNYNWCHGPKCHENRTQDRIRGVKGNKVLRTRKIGINEWNKNNVWSVFCSQGCYTDFFYKYWQQVIAIAPRTEPLETSIEVQVETRTDYFGNPYKQKVIKEIDNQDQTVVG